MSSNLVHLTTGASSRRTRLAWLLGMPHDTDEADDAFWPAMDLHIATLPPADATAALGRVGRAFAEEPAQTPLKAPLDVPHFDARSEGSNTTRPDEGGGVPLTQLSQSDWNSLMRTASTMTDRSDGRASLDALRRESTSLQVPIVGAASGAHALLSFSRETGSVVAVLYSGADAAAITPSPPAPGSPSSARRSIVRARVIDGETAELGASAQSVETSQIMSSMFEVIPQQLHRMSHTVTPPPAALSASISSPRPAPLASPSAEMRLSRSAVLEVDDEGNDTVNGYTMWQELGRGAAGVCFLAFSDESESEVRAIKVIPRRRAVAEEASKRAELLTEVAIMKKLRHKHIVKIHECIDDPEAEAVYLVMQYVPDGPIAKLSDEGKCAPMSLGNVAHYGAQLGSALHYMHRKGVMHGDIKPDNILVDSSTGGDRKAYFTDFGVSRTFLKDAHAARAAAEMHLDGSDASSASTRDVTPGPFGFGTTSPRHSPRHAPPFAFGAVPMASRGSTAGLHASGGLPTFGGLPTNAGGLPPNAGGLPTNASPSNHGSGVFPSSQPHGDPPSGGIIALGAQPEHSKMSVVRFGNDELLSTQHSHGSFFCQRDRRASVGTNAFLHPIANNRGLGTPAFLSPEVYNGDEADLPADMWAFGVTLYVMIFGCLPFVGDSYFAIKRAVVEDELLFPPAAPPTAKWQPLLRELLRKDPAARMTVVDLRRHPLLKPPAARRIDAPPVRRTQSNILPSPRGRRDSWSSTQGAESDQTMPLELMQLTSPSSHPFNPRTPSGNGVLSPSNIGIGVEPHSSPFANMPITVRDLHRARMSESALSADDGDAFIITSDDLDGAVTNKSTVNHSNVDAQVLDLGEVPSPRAAGHRKSVLGALMPDITVDGSEDAGEPDEAASEEQRALLQATATAAVTRMRRKSANIFGPTS
jgi:serine/threonine protein kinase